MKDFIAIEFATANNNRHSICAVGMVFVENGEMIDSIHQLINPEEPFDEDNSRIHGILEVDVKEAQTFQNFYDSVAHKIANKVIVAHYMGFHGNALKENLIRYNIIPVNCQFICTYQLARRLLLGQDDYSIRTLCQNFGIDLSNAQNNASACAELFFTLCNKYKLHDFHSIFSKTNIIAGETQSGKFSSSIVYGNSGRKFDLLPKQAPFTSENDKGLNGKNVVFTGKLSGFFRKDAAAIVVKSGGTPQGMINKSTDYLVVGNYDQVMRSGNKSSKLIRAERLVEEGIKLEIISEEDFLKMVNEKHL